jgi:hypothetical protein
MTAKRQMRSQEPQRPKNKGIGTADMPSPSARLLIGLSENFPKQAEPAIFVPPRVENTVLAIDLTQKVPGPKPKTEIFRQMGGTLGALLGHIAARLL